VTRVFVYMDVAFRDLNDAKKVADNYLNTHMPDLLNYEWSETPVMEVREGAIIWRGTIRHKVGLTFTADIKEIGLS